MRALLMVHDMDEDGAPVVPGSWSVAPCGSYWYRVEHPRGRVLLFWRENDNGTMALWAVLGDAADLAALDSLADLSAPARAVWRRRAEPAIAARIRYWRTLRCSGRRRDENGDPVAFTDEVVQVVPRGAQLPAGAFPWNLDADGNEVAPASAVLRIESVSGADTLALSQTLAGHRYDRDFADEEDPGA